MISVFFENAGTIGVSVVIILIAFLIIKGFANKRKKGKSLCGCNCTNCPYKEGCENK